MVGSRCAHCTPRASRFRRVGRKSLDIRQPFFIDRLVCAVRFGQLPKEERKAINKVMNRQVLSGFDHTHICNHEIGDMLECFSANAWDTLPCAKQIETMYACVEQHKNDPDPIRLVGKWQTQMRKNVLQHFQKAKILGRTIAK